MLAINVHMEAHGPIFQHDGAPRSVNRSVQRAVEQLVSEGEQRLDALLQMRPAGVYLSVEEARKGQASTGFYRSHLHTLVNPMFGLIGDGGVVYGPWLEGISSRNATTRFKGYAVFRRVAQSLQSDAPRILQDHLNQAMKEIG